MDKRYKKAKRARLPLLKSQEYEQGTVPAPGTQHPQREEALGHPPAPALDTRKQLAPPRGVSRGGVCALTFCCSRAQSLAWASCWPLVTSAD